MRAEGNNCWTVDAARNRADRVREEAYRHVMTQLFEQRLDAHDAVRALRDAYRRADREARGLDS